MSFVLPGDAAAVHPNAPFGSSVPQVRQQSGDLTYLQQVVRRFGIAFLLPDFEENKTGSWPVNLSYLHEIGTREQENLNLSGIMANLPDTVKRKDFYSKFKDDVIGLFSALYKYLTKYQEPKRTMTQRKEKLIVANRVVNWAGVAAGGVFAGTISYYSAFVTTITSTVIAGGGEVLAAHWNTQLTLAFKQRAEVDEVLSAILRRYSAYEEIQLVFRRIICRILNYGSPEKYEDKLPKTWIDGLKNDFTLSQPNHTAVRIPGE